MAFEGVRAVLHLPFGDGPDEPILETDLRRLVDAMVGSDVAGLVVLGLGSEAWTLSDEERGLALHAVSGQIAGRVPLVAGVEGPTALAIVRARQAAAYGAVGLMVLPPAGARTDRQIAEHYVRVADAAGLPVLLQDSPQVSGVTLRVELLASLASRHPLLRSVKTEIPGAGPKVGQLADAGLEVIAGWGGLNYPESVRRGAAGCMPGCDLAPAIVVVDRLLRNGDEGGALALYARILPLLAYETASLELLLLGAKRVLWRRGIFSTARLRFPGRSLDDIEAAALDAIADELAEDGVPGFELGAQPTTPEFPVGSAT